MSLFGVPDRLIAAALLEAEEFIREEFGGSTGLEWEAMFVDPEIDSAIDLEKVARQEWFLLRFAPMQGTDFASALPQGELKAWASRSAKFLNQKLQDNGFDYIQLTPWHDKETFGVVVIVKVKRTWLQPGKSEDHKGQPYQVAGRHGLAGQMFDAFRLSDEAGPRFSFISGWREDGEALVVSLPTRMPAKGNRQGRVSDTTFHIVSPPAGVLTTSFIVTEAAEALLQYMQPATEANFGGVVMSNMALLRQEIDISWLKGLRRGKFFVLEALAGGSLGVDKNGFLVEMAVAMSLRKLGGGPSGPDYIVRPPYLVTVEHDGFGVVASAYIDQPEHLVDPKIEW